MTPALLMPILLYAIVTSVTPGPNNLMLLSSGVRFGVRRSLPHMLGISLGVAFMLCMIGLGLVSIFARHPLLQQGLRWGGMAYLLWLAWQMVRAPALAEPPVADTNTAANPARHGRPLGFWGAAAFQWINPKLWLMALGLFSAYLPGRQSASVVVLVSVLFGIVNLPCIGVWAVAGQHVRHWLQNPQALRLFNWSMAVLLVASMLPVLVRQGA